MRQRLRHPLQGFGILDGLLYLALAAFAVAGVIWIYKDATTNSRDGAFVDAMQSLAANVRTALSGQPGYGTGANLQTLVVNMQGMPNAFQVDPATSAIHDAWQGTVAIFGQNQFFSIVAQGLPSAACIQAANTLGAQDGSGPIHMTLNGDLIDLTQPPMDMTTFIDRINTDCGRPGQGVGAGNDVQFDFT